MASRKPDISSEKNEDLPGSGDVMSIPVDAQAITPVVLPPTVALPTITAVAVPPVAVPSLPVARPGKIETAAATSATAPTSANMRRAGPGTSSPQDALETNGEGVASPAGFAVEASRHDDVFAEAMTSSTTGAPVPATVAAAPATIDTPFGGNQQIQASPSKAPAVQVANEPVVMAQPGRIGHETGVEIARRLSDGGDELIVRLVPGDLGRIEVRMAFDEHGALRASIAADSPAALEMLRRDSADLSRALGDAGVRSDANSLRFQTDSGAGSNSGGQARSPWPRADARSGAFQTTDVAPEEAQPIAYRSVRTSGNYNLIA